MRSEYSLEAVRRLAGQEKVHYGSQRVLNHIVNLGYSKEDVCACLMGLTENEYRGSIDYGDHKGWLDVYISPVAPPGKPSNNPHLYIKFKLNRDCLTVVLASFHPEGME